MTSKEFRIWLEGFLTSLNLGDVVRIHTGNGGGYGKSQERDFKLIENDLKNEYITKEQAKKYYNYKG